jgi:hypothetical protein
MDQLIEIVSGFLIGLAVVTPIVLKLRGILKEVGELLMELSECLEDGKISKAEINEIVKEAQDILGLFKK